MRQAVILAAGEGQRLRPFTVNRPKVMLSIGDKPILEYVIEALAENGIRSIVLIVGYKKEQIFDYLGSGEQLGVEITYITQERQLGTAHALFQAKAVTDTEFLVLPGDNLINASTIAQFASTKPEAVLVKRMGNQIIRGLIFQRASFSIAGDGAGNNFRVVQFNGVIIHAQSLEDARTEIIIDDIRLLH